MSKNWLSQMDYGDLDIAEVSKGQEVDSKFTVPNLRGTINQLVNVPGTSKYLCGVDHRAHSYSHFGIRVFDLANPSAGASIAALGLGSIVGSIKTHEVRKLVVTDRIVCTDMLYRLFRTSSSSPARTLKRVFMTTAIRSHKLCSMDTPGVSRHAQSLRSEVNIPSFSLAAPTKW